MVRTFLSLLFVISLILMSGCGKKSKTITGPDGSTITVDEQSGQLNMKMKGDDGETVTASSGPNVTIPKDFPTDVPVYAGAKPTAVIDMPTGKNVSLESTDSTATILKYYQDQLAGKGWKIQATVNTTGGSMVTATKDKRQVIVNVGADSGKTIINITVSGA